MHNSRRTICGLDRTVPNSAHMNLASNAKASCEADGIYVGRCSTTQGFLDLAFALGHPVGDIRDRRILKTISPRAGTAAPVNTLSSRYGFSAFPFHTETAYWRQPARYVLLRCISPGSGARQTLVHDCHTWRLSSEERTTLSRAIWKVSAPSPFLVSILENGSSMFSIRFDLDCMEPATRDCTESRAIVTSLIGSRAPRPISWQENDLLVIDNWRCVHARGPAAQADGDRVLERILVRQR